MTPETGKKYLYVPFAIRTALLLPAAVLFSAKSDLPHIMIICACLLCVPFFLKEPLRYHDRPLMYSLILLFALIIFPDMAFTMDQTRFGIMDALVMSNQFFPFLIYTAALLCCFRKHPVTSAIILGYAIFAGMLCGDIFSLRNMHNRRFLFGDEIIKHYHWCYMGVILLQTYAAIYLASSVKLTKPEKEVRRKRTPWKKRAVLVFCLLAIPGCVFGFSRIYTQHLATLKKVELFFIRINNAGRGPTGQMRDSISINYLRSAEMRALDRTVLLWVKSNRAPGYLRSEAYVQFKNDMWIRAGRFSSEELQPAVRTEIVSYSSFYLPGTAESIDRMEHYEMYPDALPGGRPIALPGNSAALDMVAEQLTISHAGEVWSQQWKPDGACTVYMPKIEYDAASNHFTPTGAELRQSKRLDPELDKKLEAVFKEIFPDGKAPREPLECILRINNYLSAHYRYDTEGSERQAHDPLEDFLYVSKTGHCELFATASALLLRKAGVATRYVTGYVCAYKHPAVDAYFATGANAHAWVEAWIPAQNRWILVESTPGSGMTDPRISTGSVSRWLQWLQYKYKESFALVRRGYFGEFIVRLALLLCRILFLTPAGIVPAAVIAWLLWRKYKVQLRTHWNRIKPVHGQREKLQREMDHLELRAGIVFHCPRASHQTLREWAAGIPDESVRAALGPLIRIYEQLRFHPSAPTEAQTEAFRRRERQALEQLKAHANARKKRGDS